MDTYPSVVFLVKVNLAITARVNVSIFCLLTEAPRLGVSSPFMSTETTKSLYIGSESHIRDAIFSVIIANQQPLSSLLCVNKIRRFTIVHGFYFTQCVCTGSIERSTLSLLIYYYELLVWLHKTVKAVAVQATRTIELSCYFSWCFQTINNNSFQNVLT